MSRMALSTTSLLILSSLASLGRGQVCLDFTLGNCQFNNDAIVAEFTLPGGPGEYVLCQELCQIEERCNYFNYDSSSGSCLLFSTFDVIGCDVISGPAEPDLFECLPEPGSHTCDDFAPIDCTFTGDVLLEQENVEYAVECQQILGTLGDSLGANTFVYDRSQSFLPTDFPHRKNLPRSDRAGFSRH